MLFQLKSGMQKNSMEHIQFVLSKRRADSEKKIFRSEQPVTCAELAAILVRVQGGSAAGSASFTDTNGHWVEGYLLRRDIWADAWV